MRWFWLFILGLVVLTAGLYTSRVRTNTVVAQQPVTSPTPSIPRESVSRIDPPEVVVEAEPIEEPKEVVQRQEPEVVSDIEQIVIEQDEEPIDEVVAEVVAEDIVEEAIAEEVVEIEDLPVFVDELPVVEDEPIVEAEPAPTYEQLVDGSFKILATDTVIKGLGTFADPFMVDWITLRSIERVFNPKKGMDELPDWLDLLDEHHVKIIGNTLVPVIATTTQELLVMQNPWDGCCIGIPPSPYDAIEVTLNHDVDFGSSAVGYGTVEGVFILDPYVVDGWVLGLYIIEDATYRSGDGIAFPDF